jgi:hypothetical protein
MADAAPVLIVHPIGECDRVTVDSDVFHVSATTIPTTTTSPTRLHNRSAAP